jgi:opacity protein-like surface antigen
MKKLFVVAMLSAASAVSAAPMAADTLDSYVSVSVGEGRYKFEGDSETNTGFGLAFGQNLSEMGGYEVGYATLGSLGELADGRGHSVYLAGVARFPVADAFSVYGKIGPSVNYLSGDDSETRVRLLVGAGVSYQFDKNWAAVLEYSHFGKTMGMTPTLWSVGARYHF